MTRRIAMRSCRWRSSARSRAVCRRLRLPMSSWWAIRRTTWRARRPSAPCPWVSRPAATPSTNCATAAPRPCSKRWRIRLDSRGCCRDPHSHIDLRGKRMGPGGPPGLQNRSPAALVRAGWVRLPGASARLRSPSASFVSVNQRVSVARSLSRRSGASRGGGRLLLRRQLPVERPVDRHVARELLLCQRKSDERNWACCHGAGFRRGAVCSPFDANRPAPCAARAVPPTGLSLRGFTRPAAATSS